MAEELWNPIRGDGIDRGVLDSGVPDIGVSRHRGRAGECSSCEKCQWPEIRHAGLPMVANPALLWIVGRIIPARQRHCRVALVHETPADPDRIQRWTYPTYAKGVVVNECAAPPCDLR